MVSVQGKRHEVVPKLKQDMRAILITNWKVWIPFQFLNFNFVPQQLQVSPSSELVQKALSYQHLLLARCTWFPSS